MQVYRPLVKMYFTWDSLPSLWLLKTLDATLFEREFPPAYSGVPRWRPIHITIWFQDAIGWFYTMQPREKRMRRSLICSPSFTRIWIQHTYCKQKRPGVSSCTIYPQLCIWHATMATYLSRSEWITQESSFLLCFYIYHGAWQSLPDACIWNSDLQEVDLTLIFLHVSSILLQIKSPKTLLLSSVSKKTPLLHRYVKSIWLSSSCGIQINWIFEHDEIINDRIVYANKCKQTEKTDPWYSIQSGIPPIISSILPNWSCSWTPGNIGKPKNSSAATHPKDHMSIAES